MENSERDGNTRPPDLPLEKFVLLKYKFENAGQEATVRTGHGKKKKKELDMEQQPGSK